MKRIFASIREKLLNLKSRITPTKRGFTKLITILVLLVTVLNFLSTDTSAAWYDDNYHYRKRISFGNSGAADSNKKVKFDIDTAALTTDKLQVDCDDVRFTDVNGNPLKYYHDSAGGACDTSSTDYYVLIPTINAGDNVVYMYYGNPNAFNGGQTSQFVQATFAPTSGPDLASEEKAPSPVAYWKFDEGSGTTPQDSTVNNNDGVLGVGSSAPTWIEESRCIDGKCLQFDGISDYVSVASSDSLNITGNITVSAWVKVNDFLSNRGLIEKATTNCSTNCPFDLFIEQTTGYVGFIRADASSYYHTRSTAAITPNVWTHISVVDNGSAIIFYINGKPSTTVVSVGTYLTPTSNSDTVRIGRRADADTQMKGFIDEPKIYDYARSATQIKLDYNRGAAKGSSAFLGAQEQGPLSNGLVGYWKMDEALWNGTASEVVDSSGNGNHGTRVGDATTASGKLGIGGSFDGSGDYITITDTSSLQPANISVSAWVYSNSNSQWNTVLMKTTSTSWNDGYGLYLDASNNLTFFINNYSTNIAATALTASTWTHITATYDGTNIKIYKNGELSATTAYTTAISHSSQALQIGRSPTSGVSSWNGRIDEARIYNRALSSAEVQQLYNYAPGPVGHWKMDEKQGLSAFDSSGNGNTGTLTNGPIWTNAKLGGGIQFDGSNDSVLVTDANSLDTPAGITTSAWVNFSTLASGGDYGFMSKWTSGSGWFIEPNYSGTSWRIYFVFSDATANSWVFDPGISTTNRWYHVSITYDKTSMKFYTDGVLVGSTALTKDLITNSQPLYLGYSNGSGGGAHYLTGKMDDVRIYNYARSSAQVIQDMNAGHPLGGSPVGSQVAHWKLDEGYGTTANDSSINGNSLTLSSATAAWTNAGKFGKAWNGDGALYMSRADDADFDFTAVEDFAISGWVKSDSASNPGATEYVVNKANATTAGYAVYFNTSGNLCFGIDDDTTWGPDIASCSTTDLYDATWHHFSAMRDYSGTLKTFIYVDGISRDYDTDSTSATFANSLSLYVGDRDGTNNGDEFTGDIDEVKIYRGTLTPAEIKIDYNRGQSLVLGSVSNNSTYTPNAANQEYCVPGDSTSCASPVAEWKMDEKSGVSAFDTSGNANTGTLTFGPTWTIGKVGAGIKFDGSNDYVDLGTGSSMRPSYVTVSAWIKTSATSQFVLSSNHVATSKFGYALYINDTGLVRMTADGVSSALTLLTGTTAVNDNQWHYITGIYDGSKVYIYVDGRQDVTPATYAAGVLEYDSGSSVLGSYYPAGGYYFNGVIDNMRVYDYARTAAQVAWDYNRGAPVGHWRLDECSGTVANDASGKGYTGTITIGASGTQTSAGTCSSGTSTEAWNNGITGKLNSSLKFDGTDDYVSVADNSNLESAVMSLSAWIYTSAGFPTQTGIIGKRVTSSDFLQYELGISSNTLYWLQSADGGSWTTLVSTPSNTISAGWHHFVGTNNGTTARLYIDGKEVGTADSSPATTLASSTETLQIGQSRIGSNDSYFVGQIDDVRIYNYAVTTTQIKSIMNGEFAVRYAPATGQP